MGVWHVEAAVGGAERRALEHSCGAGAGRQPGHSLGPGAGRGVGMGGGPGCSVDTRCWREGAGGGTQPWGPPDVTGQQE